MIRFTRAVSLAVFGLALAIGGHAVNMLRQVFGLCVATPVFLVG